MEPTDPGINPLPLNIASRTPAPWAPEPEGTPVPIDLLPKPIQLCLHRIRSLVADEIHGAAVQVLCRRPGDRINLALIVDEKPVAFNFISEDECQGAFDDDPGECSSIDHFTRNWIQVARVKLNDHRSISDFSNQARAAVARTRVVRQTV